LGKIRNRAAARRKKEGGVGALKKFLCSATTGEPRVLVGKLMENINHKALLLSFSFFSLHG